MILTGPVIAMKIHTHTLKKLHDDIFALYTEPSLIDQYVVQAYIWSPYLLLKFVRVERLTQVYNSFLVV